MKKRDLFRFAKNLLFSLTFAFLAASCENFTDEAGAFLDSYGNVATVASVSYSRELTQSGDVYIVDSSDDFTITYAIDNPGNFTLLASCSGGYLNGTVSVNSSGSILVTYSASDLAALDGLPNSEISSSLSIYALTPLGKTVGQSSYQGSQIKCNSPPPKIDSALCQTQTDALSSINERLVIAFDLLDVSSSSYPLDLECLVATDSRSGATYEFPIENYVDIADGLESNGWTISASAPTGLGPAYDGGPAFTPGASQSRYILTDIYDLQSLDPFFISLTYRDSDGLTNPVELSTHMLQLSPPTCSDYTGNLTNSVDKSYVEFTIYAPAEASDATLIFTVEDENGDLVADTNGNQFECVGNATFRLYPKSDGSDAVYKVTQACASKTGWLSSADAASSFGSGGTITVSGVALSEPTSNLTNGGSYPQGTELVLTSPEGADIYWTYTTGSGYTQGDEASPANILFESGGSYTVMAFAHKDYCQSSAIANYSYQILCTEIYVSADGSDATGNGTKQKPFATFAKALESFSTPAYQDADGNPLNTVYFLTDMNITGGIGTSGTYSANLVGCMGGTAKSAVTFYCDTPDDSALQVVSGQNFAIEKINFTQTSGAAANKYALILDNGKLTIKDCSIKGVSAYGSIGVDVASGATLTISDTTITGNTALPKDAGWTGGAVIVHQNATFNISGAVKIYGNTGNTGYAANLSLGENSAMSLINVLGDISGSIIYVRLDSSVYPTTGSPRAFTSGYSTYCGTKAPSTYFTSENSGLALALDSGEAALAVSGGSFDLGEVYSVSFGQTHSASLYTFSATATPTSGSAVDITSAVSSWSMRLYYLNSYTGTSFATNSADLSALAPGTYIMKITAVYDSKVYSGEVEFEIE